jgi:hypothetical protein
VEKKGQIPLLSDHALRLCLPPLPASVGSLVQAASTTSKWSTSLLNQFLACLAGMVLGLWLFGDYAFSSETDPLAMPPSDLLAMSLDEDSLTILTRLSEEAFVELASVWSSSSVHQDKQEGIYGDTTPTSLASHLNGADFESAHVSNHRVQSHAQMVRSLSLSARSSSARAETPSLKSLPNRSDSLGDSEARCQTRLAGAHPVHRPNSPPLNSLSFVT